MDWMQLTLAVGVVASLVLHYLGRKSKVAEAAAEVVDKAEQMAAPAPAPKQ